MHELQVTEQILNIALKHVEGHDVNRIVNIHLRIGELTDLEEEYGVVVHVNSAINVGPSHLHVRCFNDNGALVKGAEIKA